jgi:hypothetical protein
MGILIQKTNINTKCFYVSPMSRTSMCVRVRVEHSSILCNGNARGRSSVRSDAASRASTCYRPNQRVSSSVRLLHLSQKYLPTHSPIARFTTPCGRQSAPLRIHRSGHLPLRALILRCSRSLLLPVAHPTCVVRRVAHLSWCWWSHRASQVGPHRAKGTHERNLCWWCSCAAARRRLPRRGRNQPPWYLLPPMLQIYVSSVFIWML